MKKIKSVILGGISVTILVAAIGFFATFGLAMIGLFSSLAIAAALAAKVSPLLARRKGASGRVHSNDDWSHEPNLA